MIVGSLGEIVFEVSEMRLYAPGQISISRDIKYEAHQVLGDFPRPEYIGPDLFATSLELVLRSDLGSDPLEDANRFHQLALDGEVLRLIIANVNIGQVTIRKISQVWQRLASDGDGLASIALSLELREYR